MNRIILILIALLSLSVGRAQDMSQLMQPLPLDPETRHGTLPNGLTYYIRHNERPQGQANFYIAQKVGSVLEEDDQRGLAHFLEHICFNGTKNFPGNEVIRYLESIGVKFGAQLNAYTSVDETVYNINNVPTEREETVDSVLLILHDWSHDLTLDPEEIDKERGVIHEEWRLRSSALMRIFERQLPRLMSNSRPGNRLPIGLMEVVDSFKPEALRAYYEKWYRPDLQAIIVVGDLDVDRTEQSIKDLFGPIPMPEDPAERVYYDVPDNEEAIVVSDSDKEQ
ncbi:MAG: insulinase family protein, partial [Prevotellaceae bacterium]|nr:insulinase family protein [Prevotellaceae bacterium]